VADFVDARGTSGSFSTSISDQELCSFQDEKAIQMTDTFYDDLAKHYHLIFEDWERSIARQATVLGPILERATGKSSPYVLDCACGIGTQTLGLAQRGHQLVASDLSRMAVERATREAQQRQLAIPFHVCDMRELRSIPESGFDAVLAADNALPHLLSQADLELALVQIAEKLAPSGIFVATLRDYDKLIAAQPTIQPPAFYSQGDGERIVHQIWRWRGNEYDMHLYLTIPAEAGWTVKHFHSRYRALLRSDLNRALQASGFGHMEWLEPEDTPYYQPIVVARKSEASI
jgi:glycine/sarcosine N-methyltransferase